jgi:hypothetical protein
VATFKVQPSAGTEDKPEYSGSSKFNPDAVLTSSYECSGPMSAIFWDEMTRSRYLLM